MRQPIQSIQHLHAAEPQSLWNEHQVAAHLGISVATLRRWRLLNKGPKWIKLGACVRYRPEDIEAFINGRAA